MLRRNVVLIAATTLLLLLVCKIVEAQQIHCTSTRVGNTTYTTCR